MVTIGEPCTDIRNQCINKMYFLFGHQIQLKQFDCAHEDIQGGPIRPSVNIFVKVTNGCNAHCAFCCNAGAKPIERFDMGKLEDVILEVKRQGIIVNRLNVTGGEPAVVPQRVEQLLEIMNKPNMQDVHVHLNTNGLLTDSQKMMRNPRWDSISVSLHHYDHKKLEEIYGISFQKDVFNFKGIDMMKVNASCNLIKGYIDSTEEAHHMMDFCLDHGFTRLGFVGLMNVNDFCRERMISLDTLQLSKVPHCYFTESKHRGPDCRCSNYQYNRHLRVLDVYMRHYVNPHYCKSSLLYDGQYLRQGFHDNNIIY